MASIFPTILILAGKRLRVTGTITGWFLVGSGAGGMLLPWLIGQAFTLLGPGSMMFIIVADLNPGDNYSVGLYLWQSEGCPCMIILYQSMLCCSLHPASRRGFVYPDRHH